MQTLNRNSDKLSILNASQIGVEFEFYSNHGLEETRDMLKVLLGRDIRIETKAHSDFQPDDKTFKMEPDMSGGKGLIELVTGAVPYRNARIMIIKMLGWIRENGYTTERSSIHLNLSFQKDFLDDKNTISKMNTLKFILEFNEDQVYKLFPNRKDSIYAKSIKWVMPKNESFYFDSSLISQMNFNFPNTKYYGVNFDKKVKNYLEFRYIGGKDYENKQDSILYLVDRFIVQMWKSCSEPEFTETNKIELKKILNKNLPFREILSNYTNLKKHYPSIEVMSDLQEVDAVIRLQWDRIKNKIVSLISQGGMVEGIINYDSDIGRLQVKDGKFPVCYEIDGVDLIDCHVNGNVFNSNLHNCDVTRSVLKGCNLYNGTDVSDSKIESSYVHASCTAKNCYVFGRDGVFKGKMIGGIFREGFIDDNTRFDETEVVVSKKINS
jgi:uncharacterized protein YjbI with pentapeptide repeats